MATPTSSAGSAPAQALASEPSVACCCLAWRCWRESVRKASACRKTSDHQLRSAALNSRPSGVISTSARIWKSFQAGPSRCLPLARSLTSLKAEWGIRVRPDSQFWTVRTLTSSSLAAVRWVSRSR